MLRRLYIDNYKCHSNFSLELGRLNLFMGKNGSGKSTVPQALALVQRFVGSPVPLKDLLPDSSRSRWSKSPEQTFELTLARGAELFRYRLQVTHAERKGPRVVEELLTLDERTLVSFGNGKVSVIIDEESGEQITFRNDRVFSVLASFDEDASRFESVRWFKRQLRSLFIVAPDPRAMRSVSDEEQDHPSAQGENFASWFRYLSAERQDRVFELTQRLRETMEGFHSFRLVQVGPESKQLEVGFGEPSERPLFYRFEELSDGQRMLIVLYTLLHMARDEEHPGTLILDEPQVFVALPEIQPWLVELESAAEEGAVQAVLISHNAELIDFLGPNAGVLFQRAPGGPARLAEIPKGEGASLRLSERIARGDLA